MLSKIMFLKYILYMDFGGIASYDHKTENCFAVKTESILRPCNRVFNQSKITDEEIIDIISYFDKTPFSWLVEASDTETSKKLEQHGLKYFADFPAMILDLAKIKTIKYKKEIEIKEISKIDLPTWIKIVSTSYNSQELEVKKAILNLINKGKNNLKFYLGFFDDKPAAASMVIEHLDTISIHMVATLPEYRNQGLGSAITNKSLLDAKEKNYKKAILLSSQMGYQMYKNMGFEDLVSFKIYCG